jgi:hypothetical protein
VSDAFGTATPLDQPNNTAPISGDEEYARRKALGKARERFATLRDRLDLEMKAATFLAGLKANRHGTQAEGIRGGISCIDPLLKAVDDFLGRTAQNPPAHALKDAVEEALALEDRRKSMEESDGYKKFSKILEASEKQREEGERNRKDAIHRQSLPTAGKWPENKDKYGNITKAKVCVAMLGAVNKTGISGVTHHTGEPHPAMTSLLDGRASVEAWKVHVCAEVDAMHQLLHALIPKGKTKAEIPQRIEFKTFNITPRGAVTPIYPCNNCLSWIKEIGGIIIA